MSRGSKLTISRDDIEAKARQLVGTVEETKESAKDAAVLVGVAVVGLALVAFYLGGRRARKNKGKSLVEVYKI